METAHASMVKPSPSNRPVDIKEPIVIVSKIITILQIIKKEAYAGLKKSA
jgi:hypothetical protein